MSITTEQFEGMVSAYGDMNIDLHKQLHKSNERTVRVLKQLEVANQDASNLRTENTNLGIEVEQLRQTLRELL